MQSKDALGLHDAELIAVAVDRLRAHARLSFRLESGALHLVELHGLKAFRGADLTLQNVVSRILRSSTGQLEAEALEYWLLWVTSLSDVESWLSHERMRDWRAACEAGTWELVVIEPSAGAEIAAVCERLVLV